MTIEPSRVLGARSVPLVGDEPAMCTEALAGYRDLIDHWKRIGAWTQQWTTLRNAADLFDRLGDHELASLLRDAARRRADHKSPTPIRHRGWPKAWTRAGGKKSSTSRGKPSIGG